MLRPVRPARCRKNLAHAARDRRAKDRKGLGLLFPCPGAYQAASSSPRCPRPWRPPSSNIPAATQARAGDALAPVLAGVVVGLPLAVAVIEYLVRGLSGSKTARGSLFSVFPGTVWVVVIVAAAMLAALVVVRAIRTGLPSRAPGQRRLAATTERVRFSASLRLGQLRCSWACNLPISRIAAAVRGNGRSPSGQSPSLRSSSTSETWPGSISQVLRGPLVIGIDELDKITDPDIYAAGRYAK